MVPRFNPSDTAISAESLLSSCCRGAVSFIGYPIRSNRVPTGSRARVHNAVRPVRYSVHFFPGFTPDDTLLLM